MASAIPGERDPEDVRRDVRNGHISPHAARELYGVEIERAGNQTEQEGGQGMSRKRTLRPAGAAAAVMAAVAGSRASAGAGSAGASADAQHGLQQNGPR